MYTGGINAALERISSKDKDFRYMGTSDLLAELSKDTFRVDPDSEKRLCHIVLNQLDDASGDISGLAVKCLVPLVSKVSEARTVEMTSSLMQKLVTGKDQQRDTAVIALKTIVAEVSAPGAVQHLLALLPGKLVAAIDSKDSKVEVKGECMDILSDLLHRFGLHIPADHDRLLQSLLSHLSSPRAGLRKRAIQCLSSLAPCLGDDQLSLATASVVQLLQQKGVKPDMARSYVQMIGALCRAVGYRFGPQLPAVLPLIMEYCEKASENDDELREYSLQALESFVLRCPKDVSPHCEAILQLALNFLSYDPNFTDDAMDEEEEGGQGEEDEEDEEEEDEEYSDDEDVSWKVRRAAAKCIESITSSRPEMLATLYKQACPKLIERFKEREENVKIDVFNAFIALLRETSHVSKGLLQAGQAQPGSPLILLQSEAPRVVRLLNKQLKEKSIKTKVGVFSVLRELVLVLPGCLSDTADTLLPGICKALQDKAATSTLKIEALVFTRLAIASHAPEVFQPHIKTLLPPVLSAADDRYYKVKAEALRVCGEVVRVIRPAPGDKQKDAAFNFAPFVSPIYDTILKKLTAQDQDLEVKECAITCMGLVVSSLGDTLQAQLSTCLPLLLDRLRNEITRFTAVKAFGSIAVSPLHIDLSSVLQQAVTELTSFLRKANRVLRLGSLSALNSLMASYADQIPAAVRDGVISELAPLVSDSDLAIAASALHLCCAILAHKTAGTDAVAVMTLKVLPQALLLVRSPLLQGSALQMLQEFFAAQVQNNPTIFDSLLSELLSSPARATASTSTSSTSHRAPSTSSSATSTSRPAFVSLAQCVAGLCIAAGADKCSETAEKLLSSLQAAAGRSTPSDSHSQLLALLCLGEIGRRVDLSSHTGLVPLVMSSFASPLEEVKTAASFALGSIAAGNHVHYLPVILHEIDAQPKLQYLLLHSLKETISGRPGSSTASGHVELQPAELDKVLALLFSHAESEEEGVRNVVAECLGRLALLEPTRLLPALKEKADSGSPFSRATVAMALKFMLPDEPHPIDAPLHSHIATFLFLLKDPDRHVRRAAVLALSTAAHNKPSLVGDLLPELLPLLYDQMLVKAEMIRTVDLGPFKHTVDDGLDLRKASFDCMDTLLSTCLHRIHPSSFITPFLLSGLADNYDVKMPCHIILIKLTNKCSPAVLAVVDALLEPLEKTVTTRLKTDAVKQEVDRNEDMIRSALRVVDALSRIPNIDSSSRFKSFMNNIVRVGPIGQLYAQVKSEHDAFGGDRSEM